MRIGVVGTGNVGGTLAKRFAERHEVKLGARSPRAPEVQSLAAACGPSAEAVSVAAAADFGQVVFLATPWAAALDVVRKFDALDRKVLVDCTNPVGPGLCHALVSGSGAEAIAAAAPGARVVKAFNTAGFEVFADPLFGNEPASLFLCGDAAEAKQTVADLGRELGFEPVDCGPLAQARRLEELALLWISLAAQGQGRAHAFRLMRR